jgi:hypothetical protein
VVISNTKEGIVSTTGTIAETRATPRGRIRARPRSAMSALLIGIASGGCSEAVSPAEISERDARQYVTPAVAAQMTSDGRFPDTRPDLSMTTGVTVRDASLLASAYVKTFGRNFEESWSNESGRHISVRDFVICGRLDYLESAYEALPADAGPNFRQLHSGFWLVRFCEGSGVPAVEVSVSDAATDVPTVRDGRFLAGDLGDAIKSQGIRATLFHTGRPDRAVANAAARSAVVMTGLPRLVHAGGQYAAQAAYWLMPAAGRAPSGGRPGASRRLWSIGGSSDALLIVDEALGAQDAGADTLIERLPGGGGRTRILRRRADMPRSLLDSIRRGAVR